MHFLFTSQSKYSSSLCCDGHALPLELIQLMVEKIFRRILCQSKVHNLHVTKCNKLFLLVYKVSCLLSAVPFTLESEVSQTYNGVDSPLWTV